MLIIEVSLPATFCFEAADLKGGCSENNKGFAAKFFLRNLGSSDFLSVDWANDRWDLMPLLKTRCHPLVSV